MSEPQRWKPFNDMGGRLKAVMVVPHEWDAEGNVTYFKVWADGSPERDGNSKVWGAETFRRYYQPEKS